MHRVQLLLAIFVMVRIITATTSIGTTNDPGTTTSNVMSPHVMLDVLRLTLCVHIYLYILCTATIICVERINVFIWGEITCIQSS